MTTITLRKTFLCPFPLQHWCSPIRLKPGYRYSCIKDALFNNGNFFDSRYHLFEQHNCTIGQAWHGKFVSSFIAIARGKTKYAFHGTSLLEQTRNKTCFVLDQNTDKYIADVSTKSVCEVQGAFCLP